jgi:hypothetical protein
LHNVSCRFNISEFILEDLFASYVPVKNGNSRELADNRVIKRGATPTVTNSVWVRGGKETMRDLSVVGKLALATAVDEIDPQMEVFCHVSALESLTMEIDEPHWGFIRPWREGDTFWKKFGCREELGDQLRPVRFDRGAKFICNREERVRWKGGRPKWREIPIHEICRYEIVS